MNDVVIEAKNRFDGRTYHASILPKQQTIQYWLPSTSSRAVEEPRNAPVTLTATCRLRKSIFAVRNPPPLLIVCYGIGRLEFDAFHDLVLAVLSTCDMRAFKSLSNGKVVRDLCARHGVIPDQGEIQLEARAIPFLMLFDHDAAERGY